MPETRSKLKAMWKPLFYLAMSKQLLHWLMSMQLLQIIIRLEVIFFTCCILKWKSPIMLTDKPMEIQIGTATGNFKKKLPTATCKLRDRWIVSIERVYTPSTFYTKSDVVYASSETRSNLKAMWKPLFYLAMSKLLLY